MVTRSEISTTVEYSMGSRATLRSKMFGRAREPRQGRAPRGCAESLTLCPDVQEVLPSLRDEQSAFFASPLQS